MNWIQYMDYYHEDFKECFYFFDSYEELAEMLGRENFDYKDLKHKNIAYFKEMRKLGLKQWAQILEMEYHEYTDAEVGLPTSGSLLLRSSEVNGMPASPDQQQQSSLPSSSSLKLKSHPDSGISVGSPMINNILADAASPTPPINRGFRPNDEYGTAAAPELEDEVEKRASESSSPEANRLFSS